jgi:DNA-binding LacI/PurR family transcriptional regulator
MNQSNGAQSGVVMRPTITDVARRAGVSRQTVSRVSRGVVGVNPGTAARVQRAIDELGYRPHLAARALSSGRSGVIGVLTHDVGSAGAAIVILSGVERAASEAGFGVSVVTVGSFDPVSVQSGVERLLGSGCDGIVLMAPWASDAEALRTLVVPVPVVTTSQLEGFPGPAVYNDTGAATGALMAHLLDLGHRTVHHVTGPDSWSAARLRVRAWRSALVDAGAPVPPVLSGDWSSESGYRAGLELARDESVTAIFAANDDMALGVLHAMAESGRRVPEDVSVVGFDNSAQSAHFFPPLTTVGFEPRNHSRLAVSVLLAQMAGHPAPVIAPLGHDLVIRASSGPPPS